MEEMCESHKVLKTQPSPIFLLLKFYEVCVRKKVFRSVGSCDVIMSGDDGL